MGRAVIKSSLGVFFKYQVELTVRIVLIASGPPGANLISGDISGGEFGVCARCVQWGLDLGNRKVHDGVLECCYA